VKNIKAGTEHKRTVAAQDQELQRKCPATKLLQAASDSKRRHHQQFDERVDHIITAGPILAKGKYIKRHDRVCAQLHFSVCKEIDKIRH
jgi:hypothetical protein